MLLMLGFVSFMGMHASAVENTSRETAQAIKMEQTVTGKLLSSTESRFYKFTLTSPGRIYLTFSHDYVASASDYWLSTLINASGTELCTQNYRGNGGTIDTAKVGLPSGVYYLRIQAGKYSANKQYTFCVHYTQSSVWEKEFNNSFSSAGSLVLNKQVYGSIMGSDDTDYYRFDTIAPGMIRLQFGHGLIESTAYYWRVYLYSSDKVELFNWLIDGKSTKKFSAQIGLKGGTYYLKVVPVNYSAETYNVGVVYTKTYVWEREQNSSSQEANLIYPKEITYGSIMGPSDQDWYKFSVPTKGNVSITFSHTEGSSAARYWTLRLYGNSLAQLQVSEFQMNQASQTTKTLTLNPGTYYIKIDDYYYSDITYRFKINYSVDYSPSIKLDKSAVTVSKGNFTKLKATVARSNQMPVWKSSNTSVATVSASGKLGIVAAKAPGKATITAKVGVYSAECIVTVPEVTGTIALDRTSASLPIGNTLNLTAATTGSSRNVVWSSNSPGIATVTKVDGVTAKVTGVSVGTATIYVSANGATATCKITVIPKVTVTPATASIEVGEKKSLQAKGDGVSGTVTWSSSNTAIATVTSSGVVCGIKEGKATISAKIGGRTGTCVVTVKSPSVRIRADAMKVYKDLLVRLDQQQAYKVNRFGLAEADGDTTSPELVVAWSTGGVGVYRYCEMPQYDFRIHANIKAQCMGSSDSTVTIDPFTQYIVEEYDSRDFAVSKYYPGIVRELYFYDWTTGIRYNLITGQKDQFTEMELEHEWYKYAHNNGNETDAVMYYEYYCNSDNTEANREAILK